MESKSKVISLRDGNTDSFEWLVNTFEKRIFRFIYKMVSNIDTAQDLTQDVFIKIYKNIYKYNPDYPIEPWILKIAYNTVLDFLKKNRKRVQEIPLHEIEYKCDFINANIDASLSFLELKDYIQKELNNLKPENRMIILLRISEDLSFERIASILNKSVYSVRLRFYRNRKTIIDNLNKHINEVIK